MVCGRFEMAQMDSKEKSQLALLEERFIEGVGFPHRPGGGFRPDATCWAILALAAAGSTSGIIDKARRLLANAQGEDGRVCVWPSVRTPAGPRRWRSSRGTAHRSSTSLAAKAVRFLL